MRCRGKRRGCRGGMGGTCWIGPRGWARAGAMVSTVPADRYERGSVLLTSNLVFSKWEQIFKDPMTTAAAVDRLVHHSVIVELNIPSYRAEAAKRTKQAEG